MSPMSAMLRRVADLRRRVWLVFGLPGPRLGWPPTLDGVFSPIGATVTPLALFSVGLQFGLHPG